MLGFVEKKEGEEKRKKESFQGTSVLGAFACTVWSSHQSCVVVIILPVFQKRKLRFWNFNFEKWLTPSF